MSGWCLSEWIMFKWFVFSVCECFSFNGTMGVVECVDGV